MEGQNKRLGHISSMIKELGKDAVLTRISKYIADITKAAPTSNETYDAIIFLLALKDDIIQEKSL